jgi:hypothetical protein
MDADLGARVRELLGAGGGEALEGGRFLSLATLESGARVGLDASGAWTLVPDDGSAPRAYAQEHGHVFFEVLESKRDEFDAKIEEGARAVGLPPEQVVFSFPAIGVVRAVLAKGLPYMTRLALQWLRLTELREVRADIVAVSRDPMMPSPVRDLAARLTVAE